MAYTEKNCEWCCKRYVGRGNARFCDKLCRWNFHAANKYETMKDTTAGMIKLDASKMGKANRMKGQRAEREVCALVSAMTGHDVSRNLGQARDSGGDVEWGPFLFEVKYRKIIAMPAWQAQAQASVDGKGLIPAVVYRRPQEKFWVSLPFEDFVNLFEALRKAAEAKVT